MLSNNQRLKLEFFFSVLDVNGNGILQPDDFTLIGNRISDLIGHEIKSKQRLNLKVKSYRLFIQILTDIGKEQTELLLDEWIDFFDTHALEMPQKYVIRTVNYLFSIFDQDGDGYITKDEYLDMFKAYDLDVEDVEKGFRMLDENGDKQISKEELLTAFNDFFLSTEEDSPGNWIFGDWRVEKIVE